jgi:TolB-like protein/DNA-binding winged helix-turn-helix (wHTH) protein/Tfp pilus assembly protein PilF
MESQPAQRFRVGDWLVDPRLDEISRQGTTVKLVPKTMSVLCCLARRAGDVVAQEEIEKGVWPDVVVTPSSVYQSIADLRRALGDDKQQPAYIVTVPRKGYRLIAPVVLDVAEEPAPVAPDLPAAAPRRQPLVAWVAAGVVAVFSVGLFFVLRESGTSDTVAEPKSIAVLPVADFSEDGKGTPFADGLTEEMLNTLAQIPGLRVTARTSAFVFKDRKEDVRKIGRALGTRYVLEGSVRRDNGRIRVTAQLIDAQNGYHLWSKTFDRPIGDVLAVQEDIANAVAESLQVTLNGESKIQLAARRPVKVDSYELYLLGRHYQLQRTPESMVKAVEYQQQAVAADPRFALAYAGLADAHMATFYYSNRPLSEVERAIEPLLAKGLEINPRLPELYTARAVLRTEQWQLESAEQDLKRAIALNPNYADAYVRLGASYEYAGRPRDALSAYSKAQELDPLHFILHTRRCLTYQNLGRYTEAAAACDRAIELERAPPNAYWARGLIALSSGNLPDAIAGYREALSRSPKRVDLLGQLGWLYLDVGLPDQAAKQFDQAVAVAGVGPNFAYLAQTRLFLAKRDFAAVRKRLAPPAATRDADAESLLDFARLEFATGRSNEARAYYERAIKASDYEYARLFNVWNTRWGLSDVLTLALGSEAAGDRARAARYLEELSAYLDKLERNGQVWHGLHYLRADVRAMQGRIDDAFAELEKAQRLGWHRSWWPQFDPSLASIRSDPRFNTWLRSVNASNEPLRARVLSAEPALQVSLN